MSTDPQSEHSEAANPAPGDHRDESHPPFEETPAGTSTSTSSSTQDSGTSTQGSGTSSGGSGG